jgi:hypothetical protein
MIREPTHHELLAASDEYATKFERTVAKMSEQAKDFTDEQFASKTVELLIYDKGNLNRYAETLNLVFAVHSRVVAARATGASK